MQKILVCDDDKEIVDAIDIYLSSEGFQVIKAFDGYEALDYLAENEVDLMIVDVMMPGLDGFDVLEQIRKVSNIPVIMLTARSEEYDRLLGFRLGVDDYVPKPFSPKELMARVNAVLKRTRPRQEVSLTFGSLTILPASRTVTLFENELALSPKEFDLLLKLAQNEHLVMKREQLLQAVWGYHYFGDSRTVDTHIKSLRDRLGPYRGIIQTIWGVGYKFEYRKENVNDE